WWCRPTRDGATWDRGTPWRSCTRPARKGTRRAGRRPRWRRWTRPTASCSATEARRWSGWPGWKGSSWWSRRTPSWSAARTAPSRCARWSRRWPGAAAGIAPELPLPGAQANLTAMAESGGGASILLICDFNAHGGTQTHVLHLMEGLRARHFRPSLAALTLHPDL